MSKSFLLFLAFFSICSAWETENEILSDVLIYEQILKTEPEAVLFCTEGKLYLKPEKIFITDAGIFVGNLPISALFSDASGCYCDSNTLVKSSRKWVCATQWCVNFRNVFRNSSGICPDCNRQGLSYD